MIFIYLLIAVLAFLCGYLLPQRPSADVKQLLKKGELGSDERLRREYENFLNYDGTEQ